MGVSPPVSPPPAVTPRCARSPVPLGSVVLLDGRVDRREGRKLFLSCEVRGAEGDPLHAKATGEDRGGAPGGRGHPQPQSLPTEPPRTPGTRLRVMPGGTRGGVPVPPCHPPSATRCHHHAP